MKRSRYTAEQVAFALRQAESGTQVPEVCRKMGITIQLLVTLSRKPGFQDVLIFKSTLQRWLPLHIPLTKY